MKEAFDATALSQDHSFAKHLFEFALIVDSKTEAGLFFAEITADRGELPLAVLAFTIPIHCRRR